jgi:membrane fusion protein, multidrug efflux system
VRRLGVVFLSFFGSGLMRLSAPRLIVAGLVVLVFGGLALFNYVIKPRVVAQAMADFKFPPAVVSADVARQKAWTQEIPAIGTVEAINGVDVTSEVGGTVSAILFQSGARVGRGAGTAEHLYRSGRHPLV